MVTKKVTNTTDGALVPPDGPTIPPRSFRIIPNWEKKESEVVKAWIRAGALLVSDASGDEAKAAETTGGANVVAASTDGNEGNGGGSNDGGKTPETVNEPKTEAQLNELTNDQLKELIEGANGTVKSSWNKAELVAQALELKV